MTIQFMPPKNNILQLRCRFAWFIAMLVGNARMRDENAREPFCIWQA